MASPCLRYLMALQSHMLRAIVLDETSDRSGVDDLQDLQQSVLSLAEKIFSSAHEVSQCFIFVASQNLLFCVYFKYFKYIKYSCKSDAVSATVFFVYFSYIRCILVRLYFSTLS